MTGRSLLNRTANGGFKFAHRSIMEYLCVVAHREKVYVGSAWTDQMKDYLFQMVVAGEQRGEVGGDDLLERAPSKSWTSGDGLIEKGRLEGKYPLFQRL